MWNPFKKKDPMKATAGVYHLAETFIPQLVKVTTLISTKRTSLRTSKDGRNY